MCNANEKTGPSLHPFEVHGLGKAPFQYLGTTYEIGPKRLDDGVTTIGAPGQPMGTCDYCGRGIALVCHVMGADGERFKVGIDCVNKVYRDYGRADADPIKRKIEADRKKHNRELRHKREKRQLAEFRQWAADNQAGLEALPHPFREGETMWD